MATKPTPGGSDGTYGTEMNAFLDVSMDNDGKINDGAEQTTSAAPTTDVQLANKKYIDDQIAAKTDGNAPTQIDSEGIALLKAHTYKAQTTGFVNASVPTNNPQSLTGYVGATDDPVGAGTAVAFSSTSNDQASISFMVAKDNFFELAHTTQVVTITWTSLTTTGAAPIDQD